MKRYANVWEYYYTVVVNKSSLLKEFETNSDGTNINLYNNIVKDFFKARRRDSRNWSGIGGMMEGIDGLSTRPTEMPTARGIVIFENLLANSTIV